MSIVARTRPLVKPAPVKATTVLFDATESHTPARPFGRGILRSLPTYRSPVSAADMAWAAQAFASDAADREFDRLADEAAMLDRYTQGYCL